MSDLPSGSLNDPFGPLLPARPPVLKRPQQMPREWIFFPEDVPGFMFRSAADIRSRNAAVSSADFDVSTQEGIFQMDDRSLNAERALMHAVGMRTISQPNTAPAVWIKGRASVLDRSDQRLGQAMRPRWRLVSTRIRLGEGKDSKDMFHTQDDVEGYCVVGSGPTWAVADVQEEDGEEIGVLKAKSVLGPVVQRIRIFLFAPRRLIMDQIGLCDGSFTTVSGFAAATYRYREGDDGLGGVLVRRPGRIQIGRLPGYSFEISSYEELRECMRFGGRQRYTELAYCRMKVHTEGWKGAVEVQGYAVVCTDDGPNLCDSVVTQLEEGIVQSFLREWKEKVEELYGSGAA